MSYVTCGPMKVTGSSAFQIDGISNFAADPQTTMIIEAAAGAIDPSYQAVESQEPQLTVTCSDIKTAVDALGLNGLPIPNTTVHTTVEQYFTVPVANSVSATGSSHAKMVTNYGMLLPDEISWQQKQPARMKLTCHAGYDGTNNPWVWSNSVAIATAPLLDELFTGGAIYINGTVIPLETVQGMSLRWGWEVEKVAGSGEVWPRRLHAAQRRFMFEIETKLALSLSTYGLTGTAVNASTAKVYLRKYKINETRVPDATAEHIKITIANAQGQLVPAQLNIDNRKVAGYKLQLFPIAGAAAVLAFDTASAIS